MKLEQKSLKNSRGKQVRQKKHQKWHQKKLEPKNLKCGDIARIQTPQNDVRDEPE